MNPTFQRFMRDATKLVRSGNLQLATATIQAAFSRTAATAAAAKSARMDEHNVIDVEAHEVGREATTPKEVSLKTQLKDTAQPTPAAQKIKPGPSGVFIKGSYADAAGTREYKLYIPPASFEGPLPLVVMLHGCTQNPDDFAAGTAMNEAAYKRALCALPGPDAARQRVALLELVQA